jgi:hypothetical protein
MAFRFLAGAGASTTAELAVEASQAEFEELLEREGAGKPDSHPPSVSRDHRTDLKEFEPDGANLSTSQFSGLEAKPAQRFNRHSVEQLPNSWSVKFQQRYQNSHRPVISGIVGCPLDADPLESLLIRLFDRVQWAQRAMLCPTGNCATSAQNAGRLRRHGLVKTLATIAILTEDNALPDSEKMQRIRTLLPTEEAKRLLVSKTDTMHYA